MIGVSTIGNATLIAYDEKPIISTDPWFGDTDPAYFGSWVTSHVFPKNLQQVNSDPFCLINSSPLLSNPFRYA